MTTPRVFTQREVADLVRLTLDPLLQESRVRAHWAGDGADPDVQQRERLAHVCHAQGVADARDALYRAIGVDPRQYGEPVLVAEQRASEPKLARAAANQGRLWDRRAS